ncbi:hypothetical protein [Phenylobacterium soli]|uniref:PepSY domain-containing protein n=1 Tax=Phenylobacterium soli TaxID=2170551 RepID=A0A328APM8_9CAUL|nr:hypothetical protein [Phenylobacterium soli]RAK54798.1 hypothetical protein DJ017_09800 [Phenylobacterium soli]
MTATAQAARNRAPARRINPRLLRDLHLYLAVLFAPAIIFFAVTGAVQVLGLHEASRDGGGYKPAPLVEKLAQVHIHQRFAEPPRRNAARPAAGPGAPGAPTATAAPQAQPAAQAARRGPSLGTRLVKWFFAASAVGLTLSGLLGVWIAVTQSRQRKLAWALLAIGAVIPLAFLAF